MQRLLRLCTVIVLLPAGLAAQDADATTTAAGSQGLTRPGLAEGAEPPLPSDDLAECAAILAVASSATNSLIDRQSYQIAAADWFATSGDVALSEGALPAEEVWGAKVQAWAGRFSSMDGLARHGEWTAFCGRLGAAHGLSAPLFPTG